MSDTVFRSKSEPNQEAPAISKNSSLIPESVVEVPYLDYETSHAQPYSVEYFDLGDRWNEVFESDVRTIEGFIEEKIKSGDTPNSIPAIRSLLKSLEKVTNLSKDERPVVKVGTLVAHIEFLNKTKEIRESLKRYG